MNSNDKPKTFVSLGNATQSFPRIVEYLNAVISMLPKPILVQSGYTPVEDGDYCVKKFLNPNEYISAINSAKILIFHAGAGSVIHAVRLKKKPIVVPRLFKLSEHINDHQLEFARAISEQGYAFYAENLPELKTVLTYANLDYPFSVTKKSNKMNNLIRDILKTYTLPLD